MVDATIDGVPTANARRKLNDAPSAMRPSGVAMPPTSATAAPSTWGMGMRSSDHTTPATMPRMMGFVTMPLIVLRMSSPFTPRPFLPGRMSSRMTTALTL